METAAGNECSTKCYRCILWGGYAWGNVGDELTLAVALRDMRRRYSDSIAILTRSPGYTRRLFSDCDVIPYEPIQRTECCGEPPSRYDVEQQLTSAPWAKNLARCETLYLVGGGYLADLFHLDWLLLPVLVARSCGVTIATGPIGLGPYHSDAWAKRVVESLNGVNLVVRDDASLAFCQEHGLSSSYRPDDGFRVSEVLDLTPSRTVPEREPRRIGVNMFYQYGSIRRHESLAWWAALLGHLSERNVVLEGFCFHNQIFEDFATACECLAKVGLDYSIARQPELDFRTSCLHLGTFDAIVSSRFHAIVVGNVLQIPTFAICDGDYYDNKMQAATKTFKRSELVRQMESPPEEVAASILKAVNLSSDRAAA